MEVSRRIPRLGRKIRGRMVWEEVLEKALRISRKEDWKLNL